MVICNPVAVGKKFLLTTLYFPAGLPTFRANPNTDFFRDVHYATQILVILLPYRGRGIKIIPNKPYKCSHLFILAITNMRCSVFHSILVRTWGAEHIACGVKQTDRRWCYRSFGTKLYGTILACVCFTCYGNEVFIHCLYFDSGKGPLPFQTKQYLSELSG